MSVENNLSHNNHDENAPMHVCTECASPSMWNYDSDDLDRNGKWGEPLWVVHLCCGNCEHDVTYIAGYKEINEYDIAVDGIAQEISAAKEMLEKQRILTIPPGFL